MFSRIVVGTGLTEASDAALRCMKGLRRVGGQEVTLVHALNIRDIGTLYNQLKELLLPRLEAQKRMILDMGFKVEIEVPLGIPYHEINKAAERKNASLIVVYSLADTLVGAAFTGGIAYEVMHRAERPVLVFRIREIEENGGRRCEAICADLFKHVFYPTDFSDIAERAFDYVEKIVESGCRKVTLLHVQEKAKIEKHLKDRLEEFNRIDRARLERLKDRLAGKGATDVNVEIPYGHPGKEIVDRAKSNDFSLIVIGSQGRGFVGELFLGSVSHHVARHAPVPVLIIPGARSR